MHGLLRDVYLRLFRFSRIFAVSRARFYCIRDLRRIRTVLGF